MPFEVLCLQIGQCGNAIGSEFWKELCLEHGIAEDGTLIQEDNQLLGIDTKDKFFSESIKGTYLARSVLLDLEPRVINSIKTSQYSKVFNSGNMFVGGGGGGAGNTWTSGYSNGKALKEHIMELIAREVENFDSLEGFIFNHSIAGGTGSGMGSCIMEELVDLYPKRLIHTYSIFPTMQHEAGMSCNVESDPNMVFSDVVVEPYNSVLTMRRLCQFADCVYVFDNRALQTIASERMFITNPSFVQINKLVSTVMAASTAPMRFPSLMYNTLSDLTLPLVAYPALHFLMTSYAPLINKELTSELKISVIALLKRQFKRKNWMVSRLEDVANQPKLISLFNIIQSYSYPASSVNKAIAEVCRTLDFVPWAPKLCSIAPTFKSPYTDRNIPLTALAVANNVNIKNVFERSLSHFDRLRTRSAFIQQFDRYADDIGDLQTEMDESKQVVQSLVDEYKQASIMQPHHFL